MILSGKDIANQIRLAMREQVAQLVQTYGRPPALAVIQVGDDPASTIYVRNKMKAAEYCGICSEQIALPATTTEEELCTRISMLNADPLIDGILVQLPLPGQCDEERVIRSILPEKDVDGFHPANAAALWLHHPLVKGYKATIYAPVPNYGCTVACTPKGILALLVATGMPLEGKRAVVVGRSDIVGKPIAKLLLDRQCTVTIAHSHTTDLPAVCKDADILVAAVGKPRLITAECVKQGAVVIDVGISRLPDGSLSGDVDFEACKDKAAFITPVPGGVGPMTVTMLMQNTIECFVRRNANL